MANRKELSETDLVLLEEVTTLEPTDLTCYQISVLKARREYLTREERSLFADVLKGKVKGKDYVGSEVKEETESDTKKDTKKDKPLDPGDDIPRLNPDDYTRETLALMCKDAGISNTVDARKDKLAFLLNQKLNAR